MRRRTAAAGVALAGTVALLVTGCGGSSAGQSDNPLVASGSPTSSAPVATTGGGPCGPAPAATPKHLQFNVEPKVTVAPTTYTATVVTNCGTIVAALDAAKAPHTVNSFAFLAAQHYFDHTICHRLTTQSIFVLQCGDPTGTGRGGPGYTIPDENLTGATYPAGTLAMANTGAPHTGGSQFFFCYADTPLPPQYTPFGHVTQGLEVLKQIAANGEDDSNSAGDGKPNSPVVIESFTVKRGG
jgi:peptidyl-prolyl cis-trans isomerase B (cyclophilin B)